MNKYLGILIVILYFANNKICDLIYVEGGMHWVKLKYSILCLIFLLAVEYKKQDLFIEKLFLAMVANNIVVLLFYNETDYSVNDIFYVGLFTALQYIKTFFKK